METLLTSLSYIWKLFSLRIEEPSVVLPGSYSSSLVQLRENKNLESHSYKIHPLENKIIGIKVQIQRLRLQENRVKYLFNAFGPDIRYTKFSEDDYEVLLEKISTDVKSREKTLGRVNTDIYEELEDLLFSETEDSTREYCLDFIYKKHIDKIFEIKESIYSSQFSTYLKNYYTQLLFLSFQYTDYDTLIRYLEDLENLHIKDIDTRRVREKILQLIQEKSLLDVRLDNLTKCFE